jgi:nucleotide-binding universal stress UspA family protein
VFNHEIYATTFARAVELLRDARATKDQQKSALRALVALSGLSSATLRVYDGGLSVDDVSIPTNLPHISDLVDRITDHGVVEVMLGKGAEPRELLALLRALAESPGRKGVKEHLRDAGSRKVMVILSQPPEVPGAVPRPVSVTQAFELAEIEALASHPDAAPPEVQRSASRIDSALAEWEKASLTSAMTEIDLGFTAGPVAAAPPEPMVAPEPEIPAGDLPSRTPLERAMTDLASDPYGRNILDRLTDLSQLVQSALSADNVDEAVRALGAMVALEPGAPEGTPRNSYGIVLRRTLTRDVLTQIAPHALEPRLTEEVAVVMRRGRGEAAEVLLGFLANAEGMRERRAYMQILRSMPQGMEQVIHMLAHHQWFVVRNVAELMGDLRMEESAADLGACLSHGDHRVRRAAAVALAKIGTAATVEPLRRALKDGDAELRIQVASSIGRASRALAMPLVALIEAETHADVVKEYYGALGRIGSPEAVQALAKAAAPGGRLMGRKSAAQRIAAIEGLRLAGAARVLETLSGDADRQVRDVARRALDELQKKG